MTLRFEPMHLPFSQGVDTKSDPRALEAPGLLRCENAVFDETGGIQKRPGTFDYPLTLADGSSNFSSIAGIAARDDELLMFRGGKVFSYSDIADEWSSRGAHYGCYVEQKTIITDDAFVERAEISNLVVYTNGKDKFWIYDSETGAFIGTRDMSGGIGGGTMRVLAATHHAGNRVIVYRIKTGGGEEVQTVSVTVADPHAALAVAITVLTTGTNGDAFDVCKDSESEDHLLIYSNNAVQLGLIKINNTDPGAAAFTVSSKARTAQYPLALHGSNGSWGIIRWDGAALRFDQLSSALADTFTNLSVTTDALERATIVGTGSVFDNFYVLWDLAVTTTYLVKRASVESGALTVAGKVMARQSQLESHAQVWIDGLAARPVVVITHHELNDRSAGNRQMLLWDVNKAVVDGEFGVIARILPGTGVGRQRDDFGVFPMGRLQQISSDEVKFAAVYNGRLETRARIGVKSLQEFSPATAEVAISFSDARAYDGVQLGPTLYLPGGYLAQYDGDKCSEVNFFAFPGVMDPATPANSSDTGGKLAAAKYSYRFYWESRNAAGEVEISTYATDVQIDISGHGYTGTDQKMTFNAIPTCPYTNKVMWLAVYRTTADPGPGAPFYRANPSDENAGAIATSAFVYNDPTVDTVTWIDEDQDGFSDTEIINNPVDYISEGNVGNLPPAFAPQSISAGQSRLFAIGAGSPSTVWASKLRFDGDVAAFDDAEAIRITLPSGTGDATALLPREDSIIAFSERATYVVGGVGPDNTGAGGWDIPGVIDDSVGCSSARAIGKIQGGALFHSDRGFYVLNNGLQVQYVGAPVHDFRTRSMRGVVALRDSHQVLVATSTGCLLLDLNSGQWSDWQGAPWNSKDIVIARGVPHMLASTGISKLDPTTYLDDTTPYSLIVETAWLKFAGLLGYQKTRFWEILGEYRSAHELRIKIAYDYRDEWVDDLTWSAPADDVGAPERPRGRFRYMKTPAVRFSIQDDNRGAVVRGESLKLTGLSVEVAVKTGLARVSRLGMVGE